MMILLQVTQLEGKELKIGASVLSSLLLKFPASLATDPQDGVYGILGMLPPTD